MDDKKLFYANQYGVKIVKCCASCKHKQMNNKTRKCLRGEGIVNPSSYCLDWELSPGLQNAGKGGGRLKTIRR